MLYPCDAITLSFITPANSGVILLPATTTIRTILNALDNNYLTSGDMYITIDGIILVDSTPSLRQDNRFLTIKTGAGIVSHNSALSGNSSGQIVYVNRDISSTSPACEAGVKPIFTYGELLTNYLFFIVIIGFITGFIINKFTGKK